MNSQEETQHAVNPQEEIQLRDDLRGIVSGQPFAFDIEAIERRGRGQRRRGLAIRGLAGLAVLGVILAGGVDRALLTLRDRPFGTFLLALAALGLIIYGIYGLCGARWRRV